MTSGPAGSFLCVAWVCAGRAGVGLGRAWAAVVGNPSESGGMVTSRASKKQSWRGGCLALAVDVGNGTWVTWGVSRARVAMLSSWAMADESRREAWGMFSGWERLVIW